MCSPQSFISCWYDTIKYCCDGKKLSINNEISLAMKILCFNNFCFIVTSFQCENNVMGMSTSALSTVVSTRTNTCFLRLRVLNFSRAAMHYTLAKSVNTKTTNSSSWVRVQAEYTKARVRIRTYYTSVLGQYYRLQWPSG